MVCALESGEGSVHGKEAAVRAAQGRWGVEAAARLWRALRRRKRQRGSRGRGGGGSAALELGLGVGCSAVLEAGEEAVSRRGVRRFFENTRNCMRCALPGRSSCP